MMAGFSLSFLTDNISRTDNVNAINNTQEANTQALLELLDGLSNHDTIIATIISQTEEAITLRAEGNVLINAAKDNTTGLKNGDKILFEVNKSLNSNVTLRPLNLNTNTQNTAVSALKSAGLPVNQKSVELTIRNMEYGNPVDKNALTLSYKDLLEFPKVPVKYIVDLQKMGIEVNFSNLTQYENYLNTENLISESLKEIVNAFFEDFSEGFFSTDSFAKENAFDSLINLVREFGETSDNALINKNINLLKTAISDKADSEAVNINKKPFSFDLGTDAFKALEKELNLKPGFFENPVENFDNPNSENLNLENLNSKNLNLENPNLKKAVSFDKEYINTLVKNILKEGILRSFSLELNEKTLKDKSNLKSEVEDLYNKLFDNTDRLINIVKKNVNSEKSVALNHRVQSLSQNLDFMKALNNFVSYVQIPFKNGDSENTGELYVYKNKKNITLKDSEISAFIHLDLKNLGPTDVYVKLNDNRVTTNFTLADEACIDLVQSNIGFLTKRLRDKGYSVETEFKIKDSDLSSIEKMLKDNTVKVNVSKTSFDARI